MKIAHVTTVDLSLRFLILPQLIALVEKGHEVIGFSAAGSYVSNLEEAGIRHKALADSTRGMNVRADWRAARQLWRYLRSEPVDVLHTHNPKPGLYGRLVGRLAGVPIVVNTVHGLYATEDDPIAKRLLVYMLEAFASRCSDAELIQNPEDLELLRRYRIVPRRKLALLGNGVDLGRFNPTVAVAARTAVRQELDAAENQVVVGMVGRLVAEKGYREFFEAAESLSGDRYMFVAVGPDDPAKPDALDRHLLEAATAKGVRFLGMRTDVHRLYGGFDLFALPSYREGFPRAAMEAAASGLPVIATDIRGCRQVVEDGVTGLLVPVRDSEALARAIVTLGSDPVKRSRMGQDAAARAVTYFDERKVVDIVLATYQQAAQRQGLSWMLAADGQVIVRRATREDAAAVAQLHSAHVSTDFLSLLGERFLRAFFGFLMDDPDSAVFVADVEGSVIGFIAGTENIRHLYRSFAWRRGTSSARAFLSGIAHPSTLGRLVEAVRHGTRGGPGSAELLSMAVAPRFRGRGLARDLSTRLQSWAREHGKSTIRVVLSADNETAIAAFQRLGFTLVRPLDLHGVQSLELLWRS